jgi:hypothetical protein
MLLLNKEGRQLKMLCVYYALQLPFTSPETDNTYMYRGHSICFRTWDYLECGM